MRRVSGAWTARGAGSASQGVDAPGAGVLVAVLAGGGEDDKVLAGDERVGGSGHRLDAERLARVDGEIVAGEHLHPRVATVHPEHGALAGARVADDDRGVAGRVALQTGEGGVEGGRADGPRLAEVEV